MPEANWACPICQAAHLSTLTVSEGVIDTHRDEHYGDGGSNADVFPQPDGTYRLIRGGNGNRWANREQYNPQPKSDWVNFIDGTEVEAPLPDGDGVGLKLSDFIKALDDAPTGEPEPERITDEAWRLVMGDRQSAYNHPASDFEATGRMWGAVLTNWLRSQGLMLVSDGTNHDVDFSSDRVPDIDPRIVALMIAMVKVSRESHKHKHDNLVDLIGYALCADRIERDY